MVMSQVHGIYFIGLKISFKIIEDMSGPEAGNKIKDIILKKIPKGLRIAHLC